MCMRQLHVVKGLNPAQCQIGQFTPGLLWGFNMALYGNYVLRNMSNNTGMMGNDFCSMTTQPYSCVRFFL